MIDMNAVQRVIPQKKEFVMGNDACAYGAIAAGCNFFAGYPITPSSEIPTLLAKLLPKVGGVFIQMEDEIASLSACIGAAWTGAKTLTVTSGPGLSLMNENIGYAFMTETPLVIIDTQRAGPSQGQAGKAGQGDVMQARFGSHGDYEIIALSPKDAMECFTLTIQAFNFAEKYRTPVILLSDAVLAHLKEVVDFSVVNNIPVVQRKRPQSNQPACIPFCDAQSDCIPPMPFFGEGHNLLVTGSTHTAEGIRDTVQRSVHEKLVKRLFNKINNHRDEMVLVEERYTSDCEYLAISYGAPSRPTIGAVERLRKQGYCFGFFRPIVLWPSPENKLKQLAKKVKRVYLVEMSLRGYKMEIERLFGPDVVVHIPKLTEVHTSEEIYQSICNDLGDNP